MGFTSVDMLFLFIMFVSIAGTTYTGFTSTVLSWIQFGLSASITYHSWLYFFNPQKPAFLMTDSYIAAGIILVIEFMLWVWILKRIKNFIASRFKGWMYGLLDRSLGSVLGLGQGLLLSIAIFAGTVIGLGGLDLRHHPSEPMEVRINTAQLPSIVSDAFFYDIMSAFTTSFLTLMPSTYLKQIHQLVTTLHVLKSGKIPNFSPNTSSPQQSGIPTHSTLNPSEQEQMMELLKHMLKNNNPSMQE